MTSLNVMWFLWFAFVSSVAICYSGMLGPSIDLAVFFVLVILPLFVAIEINVMLVLMDVIRRLEENGKN